MNAPRTTLGSDAAPILARVTDANSTIAASYPGAPALRQPMHVVYESADRFALGRCRELGLEALEGMERCAPDPFTFARTLGLVDDDALPSKRKKAKKLLRSVREDPDRARREHPDAWLAAMVHQRVIAKLHDEPVEDYRIDFEDGYGVRPDAEEDREALRVGAEIAKGRLERRAELPPFVGVRVKPLNEQSKARAVRTLDLVVSETHRVGDGWVPERFTVTMPKVTCAEQVRAMDACCSLLESRLKLRPNTIAIEIMIELTHSVFDREGRFVLPSLSRAAPERVIGVHFGTYDYTASNSISAAHQKMGHPACQSALSLLKIAYENTGVFLSDGATNVLAGPMSDVESVHRAWRAAAADVQRSLENGYYQGWDMCAYQLAARFGAVYAFFLRGFDTSATRLRRFLSRAAQATMVGDAFDDAATGQALLNHFLRASSCGAITEAELAATSLSAEDIRCRSFATVLARRTGARR